MLRNSYIPVVGLLNCAMHRTESDEQIVLLKNKTAEAEKQFLSCVSKEASKGKIPPG